MSASSLVFAQDNAAKYQQQLQQIQQRLLENKAKDTRVNSVNQDKGGNGSQAGKKLTPEELEQQQQAEQIDALVAEQLKKFNLHIPGLSDDNAQAKKQPQQPAAGQVAGRPVPGSETAAKKAVGAVPAQQMVQALAPPTDLREQAFATMVQGLLPMSPDQVHRLKQYYDASQFAAAAPAGVPPKPIATSQIVNLAPGSTPPVIRLSAGFVSSLVFLDSSGSPWPIEAYDLGNPQAFNIQWDKASNTLMIQASSLYTYGNMAVKLKDLSTPVMITLTPGQKAVDYRVDLRIQGHGPNAKPMATGEALPGQANPVLLSVLDGIPPPGGRALSVIGSENSQAWLVDSKLFVRTRLTVLSPSWISKMQSADGMHAYEMLATPMKLVSQNGKAVQLKLQGL